MLTKKADLQLAVFWLATAALIAACVAGDVGRAGRGTSPGGSAAGPFIEALPEAGARPRPAPMTASPRKAVSPYAVGGHRSIDAEQVLRLIQAGELSGHEAMNYGSEADLPAPGQGADQ